MTHPQHIIDGAAAGKVAIVAEIREAYGDAIADAFKPLADGADPLAMYFVYRTSSGTDMTAGGRDHEAFQQFRRDVMAPFAATHHIEV